MDVVGRPLAGDDDTASADEIGEIGQRTVTVDPSSGLNLTPRDAPVIHGRRGASTRKWPWFVVLAVIVGGIGFVISHAINDATVYFLNADEAVSRQTDLGPTKNFRLQGTVVAGTKRRTAQGVSFDVTFNGVEVPVDHVGDPPELFQDNIPVVLQGHWSSAAPGAPFASDLILVKHSENYEAKNPDRQRQADEGGRPPGSLPAGGRPVSP